MTIPVGDSQLRGQRNRVERHRAVRCGAVQCSAASAAQQRANQHSARAARTDDENCDLPLADPGRVAEFILAREHHRHHLRNVIPNHKQIARARADTKRLQTDR